MNKIFKVLLFTLLMLFSDNVFAYDTSDTGWVVDDFKVKAEVDKDRSIVVTENISVNFNDLQKHGIYRYVPYSYKRNGNNYNLRIQVLDVTRNGKSASYEESRSSGKLELKIGDADIFITGKSNYEIKYKLQRAINDIDNNSEFYWNVTGNDWPVEIKNSEIEIIWPSDVLNTRDTCFVGEYGSNQRDCKIGKGIGNTVKFQTSGMLPGEGFTIVSSIDKQYLDEFKSSAIIWWFLQDNWYYFIPLFVLIYLLYVYFKHGRDPKGKVAIAPEFAPPAKLGALIMGTLEDENVDPRDISALIVELAVKGYLKIKEIKGGLFSNKDYEFIKIKKDTKGLVGYEKQFYNDLFESGDEVKVSDLKTFYKKISDLKTKTYDHILGLGYFEKNPETVRNNYLLVGFLVMFIGFFLVGFSVSLMISLIISSIIILIFSFVMPKKTPEGVEIVRQIKGFRLYIEKAEKYRQQFNEKENIFEKYLPYAMAFGVVDKWAKAFKDLGVRKPEWYEGTGNFNAVVFASSMNNMQNSVNSTMVTAGSGGSGFSGGSGGGFGGGGGGSW